MGQFNALAPHYDELMQIVPYDEWAEYVMTLFAFAEHTPRRVLDCACGTGNVTFELARRGLEATGVDLSVEMIRAAQAKVPQAKVPQAKVRGDSTARGNGSPAPSAPRFVQADLSDFDLGESFDSATCLYDSLNYILEADKLQAAFARIAAHLEPGGVLVFDLNSEYALMADLFTQRNFDANKKLHYDWQARFDRESHICTVEMRFERTTDAGAVETFCETHRERAYSRRAIEAMLQSAGWELLRTFDAYTLNPPHTRSERWYFVARRR